MRTTGHPIRYLVSLIGTGLMLVTLVGCLTLPAGSGASVDPTAYREYQNDRGYQDDRDDRGYQRLFRKAYNGRRVTSVQDLPCNGKETHPWRPGARPIRRT
jgi:hypothetical protein